MKRPGFICILLLLFAPALVSGVKNCPACDYRLESQSFECPKCLRLIAWPHSPQRSLKAKIVLRTGKDAFIRHPNSQNRAYKADKNAGADLTGQIGSWGFLTGLRYLICFDVLQGFKNAGISPETFKLKRAKLRLVVADNPIRQEIPVRVFPLSRPFIEGTGKFHIRSKIPNGCTWMNSTSLLSWHSPGGDYFPNLSCSSIPENKRKKEIIIDVTSIYQFRFEEYRKTGVWNDPGMIIMRDQFAPGSFTYMSIFSLESTPRGGEIISPQLFIE